MILAESFLRKTEAPGFNLKVMSKIIKNLKKKTKTPSLSWAVISADFSPDMVYTITAVHLLIFIFILGEYGDRWSNQRQVITAFVIS